MWMIGNYPMPTDEIMVSFLDDLLFSSFLYTLSKKHQKPFLEQLYNINNDKKQHGKQQIHTNEPNCFDMQLYQSNQALCGDIISKLFG